MAFFDDLGKKISNAGQGVAQSTQNFANVQKLNRMVSDEEKKVNMLYGEIGKAYYEYNSANPDASYANLVAAITESMNNIAVYKEQIKEIKGLTNCPNCGAEVPYTSAFCNSCGTKIPQRVVSQVVPDNCMQCSACGAFVPMGYKFCTTCGNVMGEPAAQPAAPAQDVPAGNGMKKCPNCGKDLPAEAMFCTGCGQQV